MFEHSSAVASDVEFRLVSAGDSEVAVPCTLVYNPQDPYAVQLRLMVGRAHGTVEWSFARSLLSDGVLRPTGEGDVRVWPGFNERREPKVYVALSSPTGSALLEAPLAQIVEFLTRSFAAVAPGAEMRMVNIDAELAGLFSGNGAFGDF